jgi:cytochrome P450
LKDQVVSVKNNPVDEKRKHPTIIHEMLFKNKLENDENPVERIKQEVEAIVTAGGETTGSTLTHITYYLTKSPERMKRLKAELQEALPSPDSRLTYQELEKLPFLSAVILEALRYVISILPVLFSGVSFLPEILPFMVSWCYRLAFHP